LIVDIGKTLPLIWPDPLSVEKKIIIKAGGRNARYNITAIGKQKVIKGSDEIYYHVRNVAKNFGREITITESYSKDSSTRITQRQMAYLELGKLSTQLKAVLSTEEKETKRDSKSIKRQLSFEREITSRENTHNKDDLKIMSRLIGIGFSLIDSDPKELLYLSLHELDVEFEAKVAIIKKVRDTSFFLKINLGHMQVDNMLNKSFPVIFGPQCLFMVDSKKRVKEPDWQPFIQMQASLNNYNEGIVSFTRFNSVQLQLSEMSAFIDLEVVMNLLTLINAIQESFNPSAKLKQEELEEQKIVPYLPQEVFPELDPCEPKEPQSDLLGKNKIFIELLHLAAVKIRLSLRLEKRAVDPTGPLAVLEVLYSVVAALSSISDAPIYFTELIMKNTYTPAFHLLTLMKKKYVKQAILQSYALLGSIDLIGNPIGLLDRLGSGIFEFFNEPRKGILKGPKEFAMGIGKGVKSLITNVVGGSLNSVSRVTGSLYSLVK